MDEFRSGDGNMMECVVKGVEHEYLYSMWAVV